MLCFAMLLPLSAACAGEQGRYIKLIGVDDKQITLDVDGKKSNIPLPEGYEVASRDLYANLYESLERKAGKTDDMLLCVLVNSEDNTIRERNPEYKGYRYCFFRIEKVYIQHRFIDWPFKYEIQNLKEIQEILVKEGNEHLAKDNLSPFSSISIFENDFVIAMFHLEDYASQDKSRIGFTTTYFVKDVICITFLIYYDIYDQEDINQLKGTTISYARLVGGQ